MESDFLIIVPCLDIFTIMRMFLLAGCCLVLWISVQAQQQDSVPPAVKQGLRNKFQHSGDANWKRDTSKLYEAHFSRKGRNVKAKFDSTGKWVQTESSIRRAKLPKVILDKIHRDFKDYTIAATRKLLRFSDKRTIFEVRLENSAEILHTQFDSTGALLLKVAAPKKK